MFNKINLKKIWTDHLDTLWDDDAQAPSKSDRWVFFGLPAIATLAVLGFRLALPPGLIDTLLTVFSIFAGLQFNLLILIFTLASQANNRAVDPSSLAEIRKFNDHIRILRETHASTIFSILVAFLAIGWLTLTKWTSPTSSDAAAGPDFHWLPLILGSVSLYFAGLFLLTLLMILGRVHSLFGQEIGAKSPPKHKRPETERIV